MQIVVKKAFNFQQFDYSINPRNGETIAKLLQSFKVFPSMQPQTVPDWIVNDGLFDLAIADGSLVTVGLIPAKKVVEPIPESTLAVSQQTDEEKQAEIDNMLVTPLTELIGQPAPGVWPTMGKSQFPSPGLL